MRLWCGEAGGEAGRGKLRRGKGFWRGLAPEKSVWDALFEREENTAMHRTLPCYLLAKASPGAFAPSWLCVYPMKHQTHVLSLTLVSSCSWFRNPHTLDDVRALRSQKSLVFTERPSSLQRWGVLIAPCPLPGPRPLPLQYLLGRLAPQKKTQRREISSFS